MSQQPTFPALRDAFELFADDESFEELLRKKILDLITRRTETLWQILYRLDVPEAAARQAFAATSLDEAARQLTTLIIQREIEKHRTRMQSTRGGEWLDV